MTDNFPKDVSKKLKLLIVSSSFPRWKDDIAGRFIFDLAVNLRSEFDISVLAPNYCGSKSRETIQSIEVYRYRYFFAKYEKLGGEYGILPSLKKNRLWLLLVPFFVIGQLFSLLQIYQKLKPDIIHAHWIIPQGILCAIVSRLTSIPLVITSHGSDVSGLKTKSMIKLKKIACNRAKHITVVSNFIKDQIEQQFICSTPIKVIPMGVDTDKFTIKSNAPNIRNQYDISGKLVLFVGRLSEQKGVEYLLKSIPDIIKVRPDTTLIIVGDGEQRSSLEHLAEILEIKNHVIFTGKLANDDLAPFYSAADIFVGPSIEEGFGLTFVEAAMSGCIIVGTDVGGIPDIIEDGKTGFFVPKKDSKAISDMVLSVFNSLTMIDEIKLQARFKCERLFGWKNISIKYSELLKEVTNNTN